MHEWSIASGTRLRTFNEHEHWITGQQYSLENGPDFGAIHALLDATSQSSAPVVGDSLTIALDAPPTLTTAQSRNLSALWRETLLPSPTKQLAYPVLMVDSAAGGVCNMTTLGRVLETFSPRQSGKPTLHEWN